jgi:ubiquinone/menaquinone biosynthesis C-methylase UbiE
MADVARRELSSEIGTGRVDVEVASAESLPHGDGEFDVVLCWRLLHHLTSRGARVRVLREVARVARRGVVASYSDATTWKARVERWRGRRRRSALATPEEFAAEARDAGLVVVETRRLASPFSVLAGARLERGPSA